MQQGRRQPTFWGRIDMQLGIGVNLFNRQKEEGVLVRDGLVAEYRFDEGRGQVLCDYSGNGNHGQLGSTREADTNDPLWTPQGLEFDGVDDYVAIKPGLEIMTLEMWPSPHLIDSENRYPSLFGCGAQSTTDGFIWVLTEPNVHTRLEVQRQFTGGRNRLTILNWEDGVEQLCFTWGDGYGTAYKNGCIEQQTTYLGDILPIANKYSRIGTFMGVAYCCDNRIYLVRIYNRALSPEEVLQNYEWSKTELAKRGVNLE